MISIATCFVFADLLATAFPHEVPKQDSDKKIAPKKNRKSSKKSKSRNKDKKKAIRKNMSK